MRALTDLTQFLLARIAEDEEVARVPVSEYEEGEGWYGEQSRTWLRRHLDPFDQVEDNDSRGYPTVDFIIRNSPARVLAECEAKRRIVAEVFPITPDYDPLYVQKVLAQVYSDHPDFDPSWA